MKVQRVFPNGMKLVAAVAFAAATVVGTVASPAAAEQATDKLVNEVVVESPANKVLRTTITLNFDRGISQEKATTLKEDLKHELAVQPAANDYLSCEGNLTRTDSNGRFDAQYTCYATYGVVAWGFRLSAGVQAIVVGNVNERGLSWWRNGAAMPQNAPHTVPASYQFHGSMSPTYNPCHVDYQDYLTFRHNVGPGGTGSVTFAGGLDLLD
ncbi:hypothetical protein ACNTMW_27465 [Planosporangium sp. 12N6]|uniref:hypothetical protein n=1 Tax=Planosporangium spinosum TaxID=3402278 RepID=UPI003CF0F136